MDKIKDLVKKLGGSPEMADSLIESMQSVLDSKLSDMTEDYKQKLQKAKMVCLESVEDYKKELAKKVEIYLEARSNAIQREATRQATIGEDTSSKTLKSIKAMLEGVDLNMDENQVATENKKLRVKIARLEESRIAAENKVGKVTGIAQKLIEVNKKLSGQLAENKTPTQKPAVKSVQKFNDLRESVERPKTTIKTPIKETKIVSGDPGINQIAASLDGSPAYLS